MIGKTSAGTSAKEEKTVTAGTAQKVVTPSNGKLLSKVTINPTPSQAKTATPTAEQQTIKPDSGKLLSQVLVNAVPDSEKKGLYVWKKKIFYEEYPHVLSNPTFDLYVADASTLKSYNISLSSLAEIPTDINVFLNGFGLYDQQNARRFILTYENGVMYADTQKTITATITLSGTTLNITVSSVDIWIGSSGSMKYVGDKTYYEHNVVGETVGFIVNDNPSAYPDGGTQGGEFRFQFTDPLLQCLGLLHQRFRNG